MPPTTVITVPVRDNGQLVARAAGPARIAQRPQATPAGSREVLGIRSP